MENTKEIRSMPAVYNRGKENKFRRSGRSGSRMPNACFPAFPKNSALLVCAEPAEGPRRQYYVVLYSVKKRAWHLCVHARYVLCVIWVFANKKKK